MAISFVSPITVSFSNFKRGPCVCGRVSPRVAVPQCSASSRPRKDDNKKQNIGERIKILAVTAALSVSLLLPQPLFASPVQEHPLRLKSSALAADQPAESITLKVKWEGVRSLNSRMETYVLFENKSNSTVDINWINYNGGEEIYASMAPGSVHLQPSFATHPWSVRRHITQDSLDIVVAGPSPTIAVVGDQGIHEIQSSKRGQGLIDLFGKVENKTPELAMNDSDGGESH